MKQKLFIIALLLNTFGLIKGQEKVYYDADKNITKDISSAIDYSIKEKSVLDKDSLFKETVYFISGQKKSENSYIKEYKKGKYIPRKSIGEKWEWFENGEIKLKAFYKDGQLYGEFSTFWPNGVQRRKDTFENGKLIEGNCYDSIGNKLPDYFPYETLPKFPGGEDKLLNFIGNKLKNPVNSQENNIRVRVVAQFYIEANGKIEDIKILTNANYYYDMEVLRVISALPDWIPGTLEGQKVRCKLILPISFDYSK